MTGYTRKQPELGSDEEAALVLDPTLPATASKASPIPIPLFLV